LLATSKVLVTLHGLALLAQTSAEVVAGVPALAVDAAHMQTATKIAATACELLIR
jgi:hypothetical protein